MPLTQSRLTTLTGTPRDTTGRRRIPPRCCSATESDAKVTPTVSDCRRQLIMLIKTHSSILHTFLSTRTARTGRISCKQGRFQVQVCSCSVITLFWHLFHEMFQFYGKENIKTGIKRSPILAVGSPLWAARWDSARLPCRRRSCQTFVTIWRSVAANLAIGLFKDTLTSVWQIARAPSCTQSAYFIKRLGFQSVMPPVNRSSSSSLRLSIDRPPGRLHVHASRHARLPNLESLTKWVVMLGQLHARLPCKCSSY